MTLTPTLTRKEIASMTRTSISTVIRRERDWGLDKCKSRATKKPIQYFGQKALEALRGSGAITT